MHMRKVALTNIRVANGLDKLRAASCDEYQVLVGPDSMTGDIGILFQGGCCIDQAWLIEKKLYRKNPVDGTPMGGHLESNRIKTIRFKSNPSEGYFIGINSNIWNPEEIKAIEALPMGVDFDVLAGRTLVTKYKRPDVYQYQQNVSAGKNKTQIPVDKFKGKIEGPEPILHSDTPHMSPAVYEAAPEWYVTEKVHGTSGWTFVSHRKVTKYKPLVRKLIEWIPSLRGPINKYASRFANTVTIEPVVQTGTRRQYECKTKEAYRVGVQNIILSKIPQLPLPLLSSETDPSKFSSIQFYYEIYGKTSLNGRPIQPPIKVPKDLKLPISESDYSYSADSFGFQIYAIRVDGKLLSYLEAKSMCQEFGLPFVFEVAKVNPRDTSFVELMEQTKRCSYMSHKTIMEGYCLTQGNGARWHKMRSPWFKLMEDTTDAVDQEDLS